MIKICPTCQQKYPEDTEFCAQDGSRLEELQDSQQDPLLGRVLEGRWVIEERIGEGGMGSVYLASQRSVDRNVAIKTLKPELCNSREFVDRFFREARVATTINHPHCVTILDFGQTDDGTLYLAMEFLEGMPLTNRLRHPDLDIREIIQICIQISSALAAAHAHKIIHRDLKPDNVFLLSISDGSTFVKVLDFGIAKIADSEDQMTKTGQVFGTPEYMSPEQCRGDKLDGRSDLYSLGCIMYRMLSGHPPFESDTPMAVLVSHVSEQPRDIREVTERSDVPAPLSDLCMQLLSKDADQRPVDAQAVRSRLEDLMAAVSHSGPNAAVGAGAVSGTANTAGQTGQEAGAAGQTGQTLAASGAHSANDGGQPMGSQSAPPSGPPPTNPGEPPRKQPADMPDAVAAKDDPVVHPGTIQSETSTSPSTHADKKKSKLPLILGVGFALLLAAGCAVGGLYAAYDYVIGDDGDKIDIAGLFGSDGDESAGDGEATDKSGEDDGDRADDSTSDDDSPGTEVAVVDDGPAVPTGGPDDDGPSDAPDEGGADDNGSDDESADNSGGAKSDDDDTASGSAQRDDSGKADDDRDDDDSSDNSGSSTSTKTANIQINAEKAEVAVNSKTNDDSDSRAVGDDKSSNPSTTSQKKKEPKKEAPKGPNGTIRVSKVSASGAACIQPNVESVVKRAKRSLLSCYSKQLDANPGAAGKVMLAWNISTDGGVLAPEALVSDISGANGCLVGKVKRLSFDPPMGGRCYVRATLRFSP